MQSPAPLAMRRSVSEIMHERFKKHEGRRRTVCIAYVLIFSLYLGWRFTIIDPDSLALSITFLVAECMGFIVCLITMATSLRYQHHVLPPPLENKTVDVLIPTYKEPLHVIRRTAMAAMAIRYPHGTYILDDGRRPEVQALAHELGIHYYSRPTNTHAKAGNLNYGLEFSTAEFVLALDADHIAMPHAIDTLLGFFADPNVAMVQAPQDYYNTDAFQYMHARDGRIWDEQSFFFNISQPSRDAVNGASSVGTGLIFRRAVMDEIGGVPTQTATEDVHASLRMHKAGYRVIYINQPIAYGIAAPDLGEYYKTRHRWAHGNIHALQYEKVLSCKGLTLGQRFSYLYLGLVYLEGWQQLLLFIVPIGALLFGLPPFQITVFNALFMMLFPLVNYMLLQELGCGFSRIRNNEIFSMARWPVYIAATSGALGLPIKWRSSSKTLNGNFNWKLMLPQITVGIISIVAILYGIIKLDGDMSLSPVLQTIQAIVTGQAWHIDRWFDVIPTGYTLDLVLFAGFWALINALRSAFFVQKTIRNASNAQEFFRFKLPLPVSFDIQPATYGSVTDISETWLRITSAHSDVIAVGEVVPLQLFLPSGPLEVRIKIIKKPQYNIMEGSFIWSNEAARDVLAKTLYSVDWHRELVDYYAYFKTPLDWLADMFRSTRLRKIRQEWNPILFKTQEAGSLYGVLSNNTLITFVSLEPGQSYHGIMMQQATSAPLTFLILCEQPVMSSGQEGLDKAVARHYEVKIIS